MARARRRIQGHDLCVIGGGIAGLTAAWHGIRWGLSVLVLEPSPVFGGQVATVGEIEGLTAGSAPAGTELASAMVDAIRRAGGVVLAAAAAGIDTSGTLLQVQAGGDRFAARDVVVATGYRPRALGVPGEAEFAGRGVSRCATCDGPLMRGRAVVVVGGGDAALQEALVLSKLAKSVTVVSRGRLRAKPGLVDRAIRSSAISFVWDHVVEEIGGRDGVDCVRLRGADGARRTLPCEGVFAYLGGTPMTDFLPAPVQRCNGAVVCDGAFRTGVPHIYAIGAVRQGYCGELAGAMGEAASVARQVAA